MLVLGGGTRESRLGSLKQTKTYMLVMRHHFSLQLKPHALKNAPTGPDSDPQLS